MSRQFGFPVTGHSPCTGFGFDVPAGQVSFEGQDPGVGFPLTIPAGEIIFRGRTPVVDSDNILIIPVGDPADISLSGRAPVAIFGLSVVIPTGEISLDGRAPLLPVSIYLPPTSIIFEGIPPDTSILIPVSTGIESIQGFAPDAVVGFDFEPDSALISFDGHQTGIDADITLPVPTGDAEFEGRPPVPESVSASKRPPLTLLSMASRSELTQI